MLEVQAPNQSTRKSRYAKAAAIRRNAPCPIGGVAAGLGGGSMTTGSAKRGIYVGKRESQEQKRYLSIRRSLETRGKPAKSLYFPTFLISPAVLTMMAKV